MADMNQKIALLERCELFKGLDSYICAYMASTACSRDYACRKVMFVAGEFIREVLLLTEGRLKLTQLSEGGTQVILRLCLPGEVVYPSAMVLEGRYDSTAETLDETCRVLAWDARTFHAAQGRFPALVRNAICILEHRIRVLDRNFHEAWTRNVAHG